MNRVGWSSFGSTICFFFIRGWSNCGENINCCLWQVQNMSFHPSFKQQISYGFFQTLQKSKFSKQKGHCSTRHLNSVLTQNLRIMTLFRLTVWDSTWMHATISKQVTRKNSDSSTKSKSYLLCHSLVWRNFHIQSHAPPTANK